MTPTTETNRGRSKINDHASARVKRLLAKAEEMSKQPVAEMLVMKDGTRVLRPCFSYHDLTNHIKVLVAIGNFVCGDS